MKLRLSPTRLIALGFLGLILIGTLILMLPFASKTDAATFTEALFTATSATCVTGLIVRDTFTSWTGFGQAVILILIQIGGLGIAEEYIIILQWQFHHRIGSRKGEKVCVYRNNGGGTERYIHRGNDHRGLLILQSRKKHTPNGC